MLHVSRKSRRDLSLGNTTASAHHPSYLTRYANDEFPLFSKPLASLPPRNNGAKRTNQPRVARHSTNGRRGAPKLLLSRGRLSFPAFDGFVFSCILFCIPHRHLDWWWPFTPESKVEVHFICHYSWAEGHPAQLGPSFPALTAMRGVCAGHHDEFCFFLPKIAVVFKVVLRFASLRLGIRESRGGGGQVGRAFLADGGVNLLAWVTTRKGVVSPFLGKGPELERRPRK